MIISENNPENIELYPGTYMTHTEFSVRYDEMMIIFILEFIHSDYTILSGLVSHFQKDIALMCLLLILRVKRTFNV